MEPFALFGFTHLAALGVTAVAATALALLGRAHPPRATAVSATLGALILGSGLGFLIVETVAGTSWRAIAPLHLCDVAVFVGAAALFTRRQLAFELLYFWGLTGTFLAMLTPELAEDFPHPRFLFYFFQHGSIVVGAVFLAAGVGMRPERHAAVRAWLWLNALAIVVGAVDYAFDVNFLYLRAKPGAATPLDWFGDWPWYLVACEALALLLFALLSVPFLRRRRREADRPSRRRPSP